MMWKGSKAAWTATTQQPSEPKGEERSLDDLKKERDFHHERANELTAEICKRNNAWRTSPDGWEPHYDESNWMLGQTDHWAGQKPTSYYNRVTGEWKTASEFEAQHSWRPKDYNDEPL
jgi:hypothetical protein